MCYKCKKMLQKKSSKKITEVMVKVAKEQLCYEALPLASADLRYSWYNISTAYNNNKFRYYDVTNYVDMTISNGSYQLSQLDTYIKCMMEINDDWDVGNSEHYISLEPNFTLFCQCSLP
jgi:hypothetical protein